jgi:hypothetical protein
MKMLLTMNHNMGSGPKGVLIVDIARVDKFIHIDSVFTTCKAVLPSLAYMEFDDRGEGIFSYVDDPKITGDVLSFWEREFQKFDDNEERAMFTTHTIPQLVEVDFEASYEHLVYDGMTFFWHFEASGDYDGFIETEPLTLATILAARERLIADPMFELVSYMPVDQGRYVSMEYPS